MKAIQIKYCGPTATKGARWKVWAMDNAARYYPRDYSLDGQKDAERCASEYAAALCWNSELLIGTLPNGDYVAVLV